MKRLFLLLVVCLMAGFTACNEKGGENISSKYIQLTSQPLFIVGAEGGNVAITYVINNPIQGETINIENDAENYGWVSLNSSMSNVIIATVAPNNTAEARTANIKLTYADDEEATVVTIMQNAGEEIDADVVFNAQHYNGFFYGNKYAEEYGVDAERYVIILSDKGMNNGSQVFPNATYYWIDTFAPALSTQSPYKPIEGTYKYDAQNTGAPFTFSAENSMLMTTTDEDIIEAHITAGQMIVKNNSITISVTINGETHVAKFNGDLAMVDASGNGGGNNDDDDHTQGQEKEAKSTYTSDHEITFPGEHRAKWIYEGDYWRVGYSNYTIMIMNKSNGTVYGDMLQLDIITNNQSQDGNFYGHYECSYTAGKSIMMAGFAYGTTPVGTWLIEQAGGTMRNYAMIIDGAVDIIDNGDGTSTVNFNGYDCKGNNITCRWTGVIEEE